MNVFSLNYENWLMKTHKVICVYFFLVLTILLNLGQGAAQTNTLRVGLADIPPSLGNPYTAMGLPSGHFWGSLYDGLTAISPNGAVIPALASAWRQTNPTTWTFSLHSDITFHNGKKFDVQAVIATLTYLQSPEATRFLLANEVKNIAGIRALNDYEVEISTREPDAILPRRLSLIKMIEPQLWATLGAEKYALMPVGTGPYSFVRWGNGNSSVTLEAFENTMRVVDDIQTLVFVEAPNSVAREQALVSGELDLIDRINPDSVEGLQNAGFNVQVHPVSQILSIALPNVGDEVSPLNSVEIRRALNFAVDRSGIAKYIFSDFVDAASQGAIQGTIGFNPDLEPYPYDPEMARHLLSVNGYTDGFPLTIGVLQAEGTGQELAYQKVGQDLAAIGITAKVIALPGSEFIRRFVSNDWGPYNAFSLMWNNEPMRDVGRALEYFSCLRPKPFFCDKNVSEAIRASRKESDPKKRVADLQKIMSIIRDLAPAIWLTNTAQITASSPKFVNIQLGTVGLTFEDIIILP